LETDIEYRRQRGNLRLARNDAEVALIHDLVLRQREEGLEIEFLSDYQAIRVLAPALSNHVKAASFCPTDGHANPLKTAYAFAAAARRQGADLREGVRVNTIRAQAARIIGVDTSAGFIAAKSVVAAAGINTPALLAPLD
jgi:sarcosine oxidase subunit beta